MELALTSTAEEYFELVEEYIREWIPAEWSNLEVEFAKGYSSSFAQLRWANVLQRHRSTLIIPSIYGTHTEPTYRQKIYGLGRVSAEFWQKAMPVLRQKLSECNGTYLFIPYQELGRRDILTLGRIYYDLVILEDPLPRLNQLSQWRDKRRHPLSVRPEQVRYEQELDEGLDTQIAENLYFLWHILQKKKLCVGDNAQFVIASSFDQNGSSRPIAMSNEIAEYLSLRYLGELAGEEFDDTQKLADSSVSKNIRWPEIISQNTTLRNVLRMRSDADASDVRIISSALLKTYGRSDEEARSVLHNDKAYDLVAISIQANLQVITASLLECQSDASGMVATGEIDQQDWDYNVWLFTSLSRTLVPDSPTTSGTIAGLTLQTDRLRFLRDLTEDEILFIRSDQRLREVRSLLTSTEADCRRGIKQSMVVAQQHADRFLKFLSQYEEDLERVSSAKNQSLATHIIKRTKSAANEIGLSTSIGLGGMLLAPPWSIILGAIGLLVGGESLRSLIQRAKDEKRKDSEAVQTLDNSVLSVCVVARARQSGTEINKTT